VTIEPRSRYSAIYVTALEPDKTIETSRELLVVALARARNTGMKFSPAGDKMLSPGAGPFLMEPVKARIALHRTGEFKVFLLDHDGRLTGSRIEWENGGFTLDGARDKTPYYVVQLGAKPQ